MSIRYVALALRTLFLLLITVAGVEKTCFGQVFVGSSRSISNVALTGASQSLTIDAAGNTYILDGSGPTAQVVQYDLQGHRTTWLTAADGLNMGVLPSQISLDAAGKLYIPDPTNNRIYVSTGQHTITTLTLNTGQAFSQPTSAVFTKNGTMYVLQRSTGLATYAAGNVTAVSFTDPDGSVAAIYSGMALATDGTIYILNTGPVGEIFSYVISTGVTAKLVDHTSYKTFVLAPNSSAIFTDAYTNVYFEDSSIQQIDAYSPNRTSSNVYGGPSATYRTLGFLPSGGIMSVDSTGNVSDISASFVDFGPNGGATATAYFSVQGNTGAGNQGYPSIVTKGNMSGTDFAINANNCGGAASNANCPTTVTFTPQLAGTRVGAIEWGTALIQIAGVGLQSQMAGLTGGISVYGTTANPVYDSSQSTPYTLPTLTGGIAVDGAGNITLGTYSSNAQYKVIQLFPFSNGYAASPTASTLNATSIAYDGIGYFYYSDGNGHINKASKGTPEITILSDTGSIYGLTLDFRGKMIWASAQRGGIVRYGLEGFTAFGQIDTVYAAPGLVPVGLYTDANSTIYTFDAATKQFVKIAANGSVTRTATLSVTNMGGYIVAPSGTIYYVNQDTRTLHSYTTAGVDTVLTASSAPQLAFLPNGNLVGVDILTNTLDIFNFNTPLVTFTGTTAGKTSPDSPKGLTLTNIGSANSGTDSVIAKGASYSSFTDNCSNIAINGTCTTSASFNPAHSHANYGTESFTFANQAQPTVVLFAGNGALADHFGIAASGTTVVAGQPLNFNITAFNADNSVAVNYDGAVHYSSSDVQASLNGDHAFIPANQGLAFSNARFYTAGPQTWTLTDKEVPSLTATVSFTVTPDVPATIYANTGNNQSVAAGSAFATFSVNVRDQYSNPATGASVTFTRGPGCDFAGTGTVTAIVDATGLATSPVCTANSTTEAFTITATAGSVSVVFNETTTGFSGVPASGPITFLGSKRINPATFQGASGLAVDSKGLAYVYDGNHGTDAAIYTVAQDGTKTAYVSTADGLTAPGGQVAAGQMSLDGSGNLYIPDPTNNQVQIATAAHTISKLPISGANAPTAVIVSKTGTTYVLERTAGLFTLSGGVLTAVPFTDPDGTANANYVGMALNKQGRLFILNSGPHEALSYDTIGHTVSKVFDSSVSINGTAPGIIYAVTVDNDGYAYFSDGNNRRLLKTVPTGTTTQVYTGIAAIAASSLGVNPSGSIAYIDFDLVALGNVSDFFGDLGSTLSASKSTLSFNVSVASRVDNVGSLGNVNDSQIYPSSNTCRNNTAGTCSVDVTLQPFVSGLHEGFYEITTAGGDLFIPVVGVSTSSEMANLSPTVLSYGDPNSSGFNKGAVFTGSTGALAIDGAGNLYTDATGYNDGADHAGNILRIGGGNSTGSDHFNQVSIVSAISPSLMTIDGTGKLYFVDPATNDIHRTTVALGPGPYLFNPGFQLSGLANDAEGRLLYTSTTNGSVTRYDPNASSNSARVLYNPAGAKPQGVGVDIYNTVYTFDASLQKFVFIAANGTITQSATVPASNVSSFVILPNNTIFYLNKDTATLHSFTTSGVDALIASEPSNQLGLLPSGDIVAINTVTQFVDVYQIALPVFTFVKSTVGRASPDSPRTLTFTNVGVSAATGETLTTGGSSRVTVYSDSCNLAIAPGATCQVGASFTPAVSGISYDGFTQSYTSQSLSQSAFFVSLRILGINEDHFTLTTANPATSGTFQTLNVVTSASDGTSFPSYRGTIHFTSTDSAADLPADHTFGAGENGILAASVRFRTVGTQTVTVTETAASGAGLPIATGSVTVTVKAGAPASIAVSGGNNQSVVIASAYQPFQAIVKDGSGNAAANVQVTFTANAGCTFPVNPTTTSTVTTDANGVATSAVCTSVFTAGSYTASASTAGVSGTAQFSFTNLQASTAVLVTAPSVSHGTASSTTATEVGVPGYAAPSGTVYYSFDSPAASYSPSTTVSNGLETITIPSTLILGTHTLNVLYNGDSHYLSATGSATFLVTQQNVWIVNSNFTLSELTNSGSALSPSNGFQVGGSGIAIDAAGSLWTGAQGGSAVAKVSNTGALLGSYTGAGISSPVSIAISGAGSVWMANGNGTLAAVATDGTAISPGTGFNGGGLNVPSAISIDASGNVWVANSGDSSLTEFVGATEPAVTPLATAVQNATQGAKP